MQKELKENPEFFKAFPHLQKVFDKPKEPVEEEQPEESPLRHMYSYKDNKPLKWVNSGMEATYFKSLLHKHNTYAKEDDKEEIARDNERHFVEGPTANVDGPFKYMERERIDAIHLEIEQRMTELSESGLSRNEILLEMPNVGVPLKDDAFFQLVRSSRTVREMLIKPNEEFTADRVIEKALRQDFGPDAS
jgi:hypothetical protein